MNKIIGLDTSGMSPDLVDEIVAELEDLGLTCHYGALCAKPKCMDVTLNTFNHTFHGFGLYSHLTYSRMSADVYCGTDVDLFINEVKICI